jgi:hypothetical protein
MRERPADGPPFVPPPNYEEYRNISGELPLNSGAAGHKSLTNESIDYISYIS